MLQRLSNSLGVDFNEFKFNVLKSINYRRLFKFSNYTCLLLVLKKNIRKFCLLKLVNYKQTFANMFVICCLLICTSTMQSRPICQTDQLTFSRCHTWSLIGQICRRSSVQTLHSTRNVWPMDHMLFFVLQSPKYWQLQCNDIYVFTIDKT